MSEIELNKLYKKLISISIVLVILNLSILVITVIDYTKYPAIVEQFDTKTLLVAIGAITILIIVLLLISAYFAIYVHEMGHAIIYVKNALGYKMENIPSFLEFIPNIIGITHKNPKCLPLGGQTELDQLETNNPEDYLKGCFMGVYAVLIMCLLIILFVYFHIESHLVKMICIIPLEILSILEICSNIILGIIFGKGNSDGARAKKLLGEYNRKRSI
ncbi:MULTISPECIES: hypothetical protein [unclassified Clostridium]|uniref:hypothetical protein n=1 Tax=unclassified Clostridium TaxID=2614128 RepID=UPI0025C627A2|nr:MULTISPECIES: hypothetical protein [unclassified Clostridium]